MRVPVLGTPLDPLGPGSWTQIAKDVGWIADTGYIAYAATTAMRRHLADATFPPPLCLVSFLG